MTPRSDRARLQQTLDGLGEVHAFRQRIESVRHPLLGWWMTPVPATPGCGCELCAAAAAGKDVHLGSITRTALPEAFRLASAHLDACAA